MNDRLHELCESAIEAIEDGDLDEAAALHARAAKIDAGDAEVLLVEGELASAAGRAEDALALFLRASAASPEWPLPQLAAAREELEGLDRPEDAVRRLAQLAERPEPEVRAEALLELARAEFVRGKRAAVRRHLEALAELEDEDAPSAFLIDAGDVALEIEDATLAEHFYRAALELDADDPDALHGLGFVLRETDRKPEMAACWRRVRELDLAQPRPAFSLSAAEIDRIAHEALAELPDEIAKALADVPVLLDDAPSDAQIAEGMDPRLLGLFEGTPLPNKTHLEGSPSSPDAAYVFVRNLENACASEDELREEVRVTILHETAHFFGLEDDDLDALGLG